MSLDFNLHQALVWLLVAICVAGIYYQLWSAILVRRFVLEQAVPLSEWPSVSILKPLCGYEPELLDNLRSFCRQDYPNFQIVFGVHSADDPAVQAVTALQAEFPQLDIRLAVGQGRPLNGNPKVVNLLGILPVAGNDILVMADSDMKVGPGYLQAVVATLSQPGVGLATCLYTSHSAGGIWSRLGAFSINHGFLPSVLVGQAVGRVDGCFGATMALSRTLLDKIGGLAPLEHHLADDYMLGAMVRDQGLKIGLVPLLPTTLADEPDAKTLLAHEVRWGRTLASIDRMGYAGTLVTQVVPFGLLAQLVDGEAVGLLVMAMAWAARLLAVRLEEAALHLQRQPSWVVFVRDFLTLAVQIVALSGRTVRWRGGRYRVLKSGILVSLDEGEQTL